MIDQRKKQIDIEVPKKDDEGIVEMDYDEEGEEVPVMETKTTKAFIDYDWEHQDSSVMNAKILQFKPETVRLRENRMLVGRRLRKLGYNNDFII